ncbi:MAG: YfhO family protein [Bacteroidetes bacterium]|nr:YfhO family protein [Bacteroidota bacterium]
MFKRARIHIIAVFTFLALAAVFNAPVFSGKTVDQHDIKQNKGSAREIIEYREKEDRQIFWTNVIFAGMPSYMTSVINEGEILRKIPFTLNKLLLDPAINYMFLLMLCFYILGLALKVDPLIALLGAIAYGFSSYFVTLLAAGHNSKIHAMAYLPGILAGMVWAYRRSKPWLGFAIFGFFLALELSARHPQMFYYFLFLAIPYGIYEGIKAFKDKVFPTWIKSTGLLLVAGMLAIGTNYSYLSSTLSFGKNTTRGKSELTFNKANQTDGLDRDYVTVWSYGIGESFNLIIPNFKGGKTATLSNYEEAMQNVEPAFRQSISSQNAYFGDQPSTSGPAYAGASIILFVLLAFIFYKSSFKYLLLFSLLLTMALAWGKNFQGLTDFFLDYIPYYNKFRAVSSMMVIPDFILPILAILGLNTIIQWNKSDWAKSIKLPFAGSMSRQKAFYIGSGILISFLSLNYIAPGLFNNFLNTQESSSLPAALANANFNQNQANQYIESLIAARESLFKADVLRSLLFVTLSSGLTLFFSQGRLSKNGLVISLCVIVLLDLFVIDKRYLNEENYIAESRIEKNYGVEASPADKFIMQQYSTDPYFRTLNLNVSPFNDATTSFYHFSLGGYHGAKLQIYSDLVEYQVSKDIERLSKGLNGGFSIDQVFSTTSAFNMLNLRYLIVDPNQAPLENPRRLGNAWLVSSIKKVETADEEISAIADIDPANTAILRGVFAEKAGRLPADAGRGSIKLKSYDPEKLVYDYNSSTENLAVFSEIWYPEGWTVMIDNEEAELLRANYALRALKVPAGKHEISMSFNAAEASRTGFTIDLICSLLILLGLPLGFYLDSKSQA